MRQVSIVDDHPIVREGLKRVLREGFKDVHLVEFDRSQDMLAELPTAGWDVIILDINLQDKSGLEVLKEVKSSRPDLPVIMLSVYSEEQYAIRAFKAGAAAYLTKETAPTQLVAAVAAALKGQTYVTPSVAQQLLERVSRRSIHREPTLSDREVQVLSLLARGKALKEIGHILNVSEKTISTYRARLMNKLGLRTTVELLRYALNHGLVE